MFTEVITGSIPHLLSLLLQLSPTTPTKSCLILVQEGYTNINDALATLLIIHGSSSRRAGRGLGEAEVNQPPCQPASKCCPPPSPPRSPLP
ncbi:hypothetical protein VYU27_009319 [Nannochloropsis oceanica]